MNLQEGDLVEVIGKGFWSEHHYDLHKGIIVRSDGGHGNPIMGSKKHCFFVWSYHPECYNWYKPEHLIKIDKLEKDELKLLLERLELDIVKREKPLFDNLRHIILYNRYRELQREFETY